METSNPIPLCKWCLRPIIYDVASGYWVHNGFQDIDGVNGLYCSAGMWDGTEEKKYASPINPPGRVKPRPGGRRK